MTARARVFEATIERGPRNGRIIPLPFDPNEVWGEKDRHHVAGTVAGQGIRGALDHAHDRWELRAGPSWCRYPSVAPGRTVDVVLEPEGPQIDDLPDELAAALRADAEARRAFESLATFYRNGFVDPIASAKRPETRARRATQVLEALRAGRRTYR